MPQLRNIDPLSLLITAPVGMAKRTQPMQEGLMSVLGVSWVEKAFAKAYKEENVETGRFTPEIYIGNREYIQVFPDDTIQGFTFFDVDEIEDVSGVDSSTMYNADVNIICYVNLEQAYPLLGHRADDEAKAEMVSYIQDFSEYWEVKRVITGIRNVYSQYNWDFKEANINKQPYFVFSVECNVSFDYFADCKC
jgi:hypothetical protein